MMESGGGVIEQLFECLVANDLAGYGALPSPDVARGDPWGDRMTGRDHLLRLDGARFWMSLGGRTYFANR